ncbi:hypothetical protein EDC04DRAFT_2906932 [Pisolithus marmoratus]|nr:hypothetical protein EDC04DRAFT_2906932 [Pisolithus marmoratus]
MLLLTESTLFWLNLIQNAISAQDHPNDRDELLQHWINHVSTEELPWSNRTHPPPTSAIPSLMTGSTTFVSSNPCLERKMLVPTYYTEGEELEDQPVSPIKVVAMGMDYDAESNNEFNQPIYEEAQTGLKCKQSDRNDDGYVTSSEVEDSNDGDEDHDLHFHMGPAEDLSVKMTINGKKVKVNKDTVQELGQASSMMTRGKASKHHCQKDLPSVLMEDRAWVKIIMPTLLVWAGSLADPWTILDDKLVQSLQTIITTTFPDFLHLDEICPGMLMFTIWCSNFGSTTIIVISHFLVLDLDSAVLSRPEVQSKCSKLLDNLAFLYSDQQTLNLKTIFQLYFVLFLLGHAHIQACTSPNTLKLVFEDLKRTGIKGALALTCAALHHTLTLYNEGMLDLNTMVAPRKAKMPLKMNKATGKESTTALMFSKQNCGSCTRQYADTIAKHDDATLCEILLGATVLILGSKQVILIIRRLCTRKGIPCAFAWIFKLL